VILAFTKAVTLKDLAIMSRQMATMIGSGLFCHAHPQN
jgi:type II secretory pathway component PulF